MNYEEFCRKLQEYLQEDLKDAEVALNKVLKTNDIELISLNILPKGSQYTPNIYLGPVYDYFCDNDLSIPEIADIVIDLHAGMMRDLEDIIFPKCNIEDYSQIRDRLTIRMVNQELNKDLLAGTMHISFLDLAGVFYVAENLRTMDMAFRVTEELMDIWGVDLEEMKQHALKNLMKYGNFQMRDICEVLTSGKRCQEEDRKGKKRMYVLTDVSGKNGPAALLLPSVLEKYADELDDDLLLLPSSINELIVLGNSGSDARELKRIVGEINDTMVFPDEILGTTVYKYSREQSEVTVAA